MAYAEKDENETIVIYRRFRDETKELIAFFPYDVYVLGHKHKTGKYLCSSYQFVGQHGEADYQGMLAVTKPCGPADAEEVNALHLHLGDLGYNLKVAKKVSKSLLLKALDLNTSY